MRSEIRRGRCPRHRLRAATCVALLMAGAACATRVPPAMPAVLAHPEFPYPVIPAALAGAPGASRIDVGWRYLQTDDLRNADLEFGVALDLTPRLFPARTGQGYVAMARRDYTRALESFDLALQADDRYVPALVGRGQALLALERTAPALAAFEAALAVDPSLSDVGRRVEVLRFRTLQEVIDTARAAAAANRVAESRAAYEQALAASPQSPFLHRELGLLERQAGNPDQALASLRRAVDLDASDAAAIVAIAELLEARGDFAGAERAYRDAVAIDPRLDLRAKIDVTAQRARESTLPAEFRSALVAPQVTRGDLAALVGVRLAFLLDRAPVRQVVMTDTQGHWAVDWIARAASAGIIEPFDNHTFQPGTPVSRGDLATAVSRLVALIAAVDPAVRGRLAERPEIADLNPRHLQYGAAVAAVATGIMPLLDNGEFQAARQVSGEEVAGVIERLQTLAAPTLGAARP